MLVTACCTATARAAHHRLVQAEVAAARSAGGARWARMRTKSLTSRCAVSFHRPPISEPSTRSRCGPLGDIWAPLLGRRQPARAKIAATDSAFAAIKEDGSVVVWGNANWGGDVSSVMHKLMRNVEHIWGNEHAFVASGKTAR